MMKQQNGIVALLTSIVIGMLLLVITTSMVFLMVGELRQANDADQSIRAYFAAEAGVEDAVLRIKQQIAGGTLLSYLDGLNPSDCTEGTVAPDVVYTCQRVYNRVNELVGELRKEEPLQIDLEGIGVRSMRVSWSQGATNLTALTNFPEGGNYGDRPAVMEVTDVNYPTNPAFTAGDIGLRTLVFRPGGSTGVTSAPISSSSPIQARCGANVYQSYNCSVVVTNLSAANHLIRMRPRYNGTKYKIEFYATTDGTGSAVQVPDQFVTIDVTARAGDVFRRVVTKLKVRAGLLQGLDYVLYSDTNICKDFSVNPDTGNAREEICAL